MHLIYNRFSLTIVYYINLFEAQQSFISILYIECLLKKKLGFDNSNIYSSHLNNKSEGLKLKMHQLLLVIRSRTTWSFKHQT